MIEIVSPNQHQFTRTPASVTGLDAVFHNTPLIMILIKVQWVGTLKVTAVTHLLIRISPDCSSVSLSSLGAGDTTVFYFSEPIGVISGTTLEEIGSPEG